MTNRDAEKRARAAIQDAYMRHPDPGELSSAALVTMCQDAVSTTFGGMTKAELDHKYSLKYKSE